MELVIALLCLLLVLALIFMLGPQLNIPQNVLVILAIVVVILFVVGGFQGVGFSFR